MLTKYLSFSLIGAFLLAMQSGATFSQATGGISRSLSGTSTSRSATAGMTTPGLGTMPLPLPPTSPVGRATNGVTENQQTLDKPPGQPSGIQTNRVTPSSDMPAGQTATASQERGSGGGAANGNASRVQDNSNESDRVSAVIGPGQLSYPAALERQWPKIP
jgi:hypothetical protein